MWVWVQHWVGSGSDLPHPWVHPCNSLDAEAMWRRTPDIMGGGGSTTSSRNSQDGRRSVESRQSWDPTVQGDLSHCVSSCGDRGYDLSRPPSSALQERERDRGMEMTIQD